MKASQYFTGKGKIYDQSRPRYAKGLFAFLNKRVPITEKVADIGSGTGIFTEQLLDWGYSVYAVEPNQEMRQIAEAKLSNNANFISVEGDASHTHLASHSVGLVTAAQAFHWFDQDEFKAECKRILQPNGYVCIAYNSRVKDDNAEKLIELLTKYCLRFHGFSNNISEQDCQDFFSQDFEIYQEDNTQYYDREQYIARILSSSYALTDQNKQYKAFLSALNQLFDELNVNGKVKMPMKTVAYVGKIGK